MRHVTKLPGGEGLGRHLDETCCGALAEFDDGIDRISKSHTVEVEPIQVTMRFERGGTKDPDSIRAFGHWLGLADGLPVSGPANVVCLWRPQPERDGLVGMDLRGNQGVGGWCLGRQKGQPNERESGNLPPGLHLILVVYRDFFDLSLPTIQIYLQSFKLIEFYLLFSSVWRGV
jgi:hypothetical protein